MYNLLFVSSAVLYILASNLRYDLISEKKNDKKRKQKKRSIENIDKK
jgi:hypothetical protein